MMTRFDESYRNYIDYADIFYSTPSDNHQAFTITNEDIVSEKRKQETANINFQEISAKRIKLNVEEDDKFKNKNARTNYSQRIFNEKNKLHSYEKEELLAEIEKISDENFSTFLEKNLKKIVKISYYGGQNTNKDIYGMIVGWTDENHQKIVAKSLLKISSLGIISLLDHLYIHSQPLTNKNILHLEKALSNKREDTKKLHDHVAVLKKSAANKKIKSCLSDVAGGNEGTKKLLGRVSNLKKSTAKKEIKPRLSDVAGRMPRPRLKIDPLNFNPVEPELHSMPIKHFSLQDYQQLYQSSYQNTLPYRIL